MTGIVDQGIFVRFGFLQAGIRARSYTARQLILQGILIFACRLLGTSARSRGQSVMSIAFDWNCRQGPIFCQADGPRPMVRGSLIFANMIPLAHPENPEGDLDGQTTSHAS